MGKRKIWTSATVCAAILAAAATIVGFYAAGPSATHRAPPAGHARETAADASRSPRTDSEGGRSRVHVRGRVLDLADRPIAGATVCASPPASHRKRARSKTARSGSDGSYELLLPRAGRYRLTASAKDCGAQSYPALLFKGDLSGLDFRLPKGLILRGLVVDTAGNPVPGARVFLEHADTSTTSGEDGRFLLRITLDEFTSSRTLVLAAKEGFAIGETSFETSLGSLPVRDFHHLLRIVLNAGVPMRVHVVDPQTQDPVAGARVTCGARGARTKVTGASGTVLFPHVSRDPRLRDYDLLVEAEGRRSVSSGPNRVDDERELEVTVPLPKGFALAGRVLDRKTGAPCPGALVADIGMEIDTFYCGKPAVAGKDGSYLLDSLQGPAMALTAYLPGYALHRYVEVTEMPDSFFEESRGPPMRRTRDILLDPAAPLRGRVVGPDGEAVPGASVQLGAASADGFRRPCNWFLGQNEPCVTTASDGSFEFPWFARGERVRVFATAEAYLRSPLLEATAGGDPVVLRLGRSARVTGIVVDPSGTPIPAVCVRVNGRRGILTWTDAAGCFSLQDLKPGKLYLGLSCTGYVYRSTEVTVPAGRTRLPPVTLEVGGTLTGVAIDESGKPAAGVKLSAAGSLDSVKTITDERGRFRFAGLRSIDLQVRADDERYLGPAVQAKPGDEGLRVIAWPSTSFKGRVTDASGKGIDLADVRATLQDGFSLGRFNTKDGGQFLIPRVPKAEAFHLEIHVRGFAPSRLDAAAGSTHVFVLDEGLHVRGTVVGPHGAPLPGVVVALNESRTDGNGNPVFDQSGSVRSGDDGGFDAAGFVEGTVTIHASSKRFVLARPAAVEAGGPGVRLVLVPALSITGRVVTADGKSVGSSYVVDLIDPRGCVERATCWSNPFSFDRLPPGDYTLRVGWKGNPEIKGVPAGTKDLVIRLPAAK